MREDNAQRVSTCLVEELLRVEICVMRYDTLRGLSYNDHTLSVTRQLQTPTRGDGIWGEVTRIYRCLGISNVPFAIFCIPLQPKIELTLACPISTGNHTGQIMLLGGIV